MQISSSACYLLAELYLNRSPQRTYSTSPDHRADITARSRDTRDDIIHTRSCDRKLSVNSEEDLDEEEEEDVGISATCLSSLDSEVYTLLSYHLSVQWNPSIRTPLTQGQDTSFLPKYCVCVHPLK